MRSEYHAFGSGGKEYKLTEVRHDLRRWQTRIQARQVLDSGDSLELPEIEPFYFRDDGDSNTTISVSLPEASGGSSPYTYQLNAVSETLADGATIDDLLGPNAFSGRTLSGNPSVRTGKNVDGGVFVYKVTDDKGDTAERTFQITVVSSDLSFGGATIDDLELTFGEVMDAVELPHAMGGDLPYTYTLDLSDWVAVSDTDWATGQTYTVGNRRRIGAGTNTNPYVYYECIQGHTSADANKPGTDGGGDYWKKIEYRVGARVRTGSNPGYVYYESLYLHIPDAINAPGASAATAWDPGESYVVGNWRSDGGRNYECIKDNTSDSDNRPTGVNGSEYWRFYWKELYPVWVTGQAYIVGNFRRTGAGTNTDPYVYYECIEDHTSADTGNDANEPGVDAGWETYWKEVVDFCAAAGNRF